MVSCFYNDFDTAALDETRARRSGDEYRTRFQIDRDRILHSAAFRRLQGKTQVFHSFLVGEYDFYRSRLTHSLEVSQVGRAICGYLQTKGAPLGGEMFIDPDLVEAACLAHDLGHPPFGHTGERALHRLMEDFGGFEGNAQTLRLLTETLFGDGREGMNPTRALLDAVLKYKTLHGEAGGAENHYLYDEQQRFIGFVLGGAEFPAELPPGKIRNGLRSLECQIMDWADDTAYSINDLSDGIRAGFITEFKLAGWAEEQSLTGEEAGHVEFLIDAIESGKYEGRLGRSIGEHIRGCLLRACDNFLAPATRRHAFDLVIDEDVRRKAKLNKRIALELVFRAPKLQQLDFKAELMLQRLFEALREQYIERGKPRLHLLPEPVEKGITAAPDPRARARLVCDWLANLTDRAAFQAHQRMFDTSSGPAPDFL
jgi:dGTPase